MSAEAIGGGVGIGLGQRHASGFDGGWSEPR
jgi:hypothetical protein